jgi:outer membrane protein assembly factor BamB
VLDRRSGRLLAQDAEGIGPRIFHSTWSSPALGEVNGRRLVFFCGGDGVVYAFEAVAQPGDLKPEAPGAQDALASAAVAGAPGGGSQGQRTPALKKVWSFDCDPAGPKENVHRFITNRRESPSNIKSMPVFYKNRIYVTVGGDVWWGKNQAWLKCIDATRTGDITRDGLIWSYPLDQHVMSTPAIHDGLVYAADCAGKVHCAEADTGKPVWVHDAQGEIWASTLVADGKVHVGTRSGQFWILAAGREKRVVSMVDLGSPISATATAANATLYVATMRELYAIAREAR